MSKQVNVNGKGKHFDYERLNRFLTLHNNRIYLTHEEFKDGQIIEIFYDNNTVGGAKCVTISEIYGQEPSIYYHGSGFSALPKVAKQYVKKLVGGYQEQYPNL